MLNRKNAGGMNDEQGFPVFFTEISDALGRYENYQRAAQAIASHFPPEEYPTLLDIGCGVGKMSMALFKQGYRVTGLDLSAEQLNIAQAISPGPHYTERDMANPPSGLFDMLVNVYTSFGYCNSEQEDLSLLPVWFQALRPGGVLIMELADMDRARNRIDAQGELTRINNGVTELLSMDWEKRLLKVEYSKAGRSWSCLTRLYEKETLQAALRDAGFAEVEIYGDFDLRPKGSDDNVVLVARKGNAS